jgi:hypothetical protein
LRGGLGSGLLRFVLGVAFERSGSPAAATQILPYMVFAVDGTVTLIRRAARGERWYTAHRSHGYQRAVQGGGWSHALRSPPSMSYWESWPGGRRRPAPARHRARRLRADVRCGIRGSRTPLTDDQGRRSWIERDLAPNQVDVLHAGEPRRVGWIVLEDLHPI